MSRVNEGLSHRFELMVDDDLWEFILFVRNLKMINGREINPSEFIRREIKESDLYYTWKNDGGRDGYRRDQAFQLITNLFHLSPPWRDMMQEGNGSEEYIYQQIEPIANSRNIHMKREYFDAYVRAYYP